MATVLLSTLPDWARDKIKSYSVGIVQLVRDGETLQINDGVARFNGQLVVQSEEEMSTEVETINFIHLPFWAMMAVLNANPDGDYINQTGPDSLTIKNGKATFNGKEVKLL